MIATDNHAVAIPWLYVYLITPNNASTYVQKKKSPTCHEDGFFQPLPPLNQCREGTNCSTSCCLSLRSSFTWSCKMADQILWRIQQFIDFIWIVNGERSANNFRSSMEFHGLHGIAILHTWFSVSQHPETWTLNLGNEKQVYICLHGPIRCSFLQPSAEQTWQCLCRPSFIYCTKKKLNRNTAPTRWKWCF